MTSMKAALLLSLSEALKPQLEARRLRAGRVYPLLMTFLVWATPTNILGIRLVGVRWVILHIDRLTP